jgi:hypothetical protein
MNCSKSARNLETIVARPGGLTPADSRLQLDLKIALNDVSANVQPLPAYSAVPKIS